MKNNEDRFKPVRTTQKGPRRSEGRRKEGKIPGRDQASRRIQITGLQDAK